MRRSELHKTIGGMAGFSDEYRRIKREEANERNKNTPYTKTRRYRRDHSVMAEVALDRLPRY